MPYNSSDISNTDDLLKASKINLIYNQLSLSVESSLSNYVFQRNVNNAYDVICFGILHDKNIQSF